MAHIVASSTSIDNIINTDVMKEWKDQLPALVKSLEEIYIRMRGNIGENLVTEKQFRDILDWLEQVPLDQLSSFKELQKAYELLVGMINMCDLWIEHQVKDFSNYNLLIGKVIKKVGRPIKSISFETFQRAFSGMKLTEMLKQDNNQQKCYFVGDEGKYKIYIKNLKWEVKPSLLYLLNAVIYSASGSKTFPMEIFYITLVTIGGKNYTNMQALRMSNTVILPSTKVYDSANDTINGQDISRNVTINTDEKAGLQLNQTNELYTVTLSQEEFVKLKIMALDRDMNTSPMFFKIDSLSIANRKSKESKPIPEANLPYQLKAEWKKGSVTGTPYIVLTVVPKNQEFVS